MASARFLRPSLSRRAPLLDVARSLSHKTAPSPAPDSGHRRHPPPPPHEFSRPCEFLGSWEPPADPREAEARLDRLRKEYRRQMKQVRRECAYDVEMLRAEKQRKDDARREAARIANEERKAAKAAAAKTRAVQRKAEEEEFRQTLLKERAGKLEYWKAKEALRETKKNEEKQLLRRQSSMWIAEGNLEQRILDAIKNTTPL